MRITGIVAEYNPFHLGHAFHLDKTLESCDLVVVAMSGSFVQRGEISVFDKFTRAKWALQAGADLVLEIPAVFCLQGARGYAHGAVGILSSACCDAISFGSEIPDLEILNAAAKLIENEDDALRQNMRDALKQGKSFPKARQESAIMQLRMQCGSTDPFSSSQTTADLHNEPYAAADLCNAYDAIDLCNGAYDATNPRSGARNATDLCSGTYAAAVEALRQPNFLLGAEYIRSRNKIAPVMRINVVKRTGENHDKNNILNDTINGAFSKPDDKASNILSASSIRKLLQGGRLDAAKLSVPPFVAADLQKQNTACFSDLENLILHSLRSADLKDLTGIFGVTEGLEYSLKRAAELPSLQDAMMYCKSKRYTLARIRRLFCAVLLDIEKQLVEQANSSPTPYLRVLGFKQSAYPLLRKLSKRSKDDSSYPPLIMKKKDIDGMSGIAQKMLRLDVKANDTQALAFKDPAMRVAHRDFFQPIIRV